MKKFEIVVRAIITDKQNRILLVKRAKNPQKDKWCLPGGKVNFGEKSELAIIREIKEELSIVLDKDDIRLVHTMYRTKHDETGDRVDFFFAATRWAGEITNREPHKCDDIRWFAIDALPKNMMHHVKGAIENMESGIGYSELGLDRVVRNPSESTLAEIL